MTQTQQTDWKFRSWIINGLRIKFYDFDSEFHKVFIWYWAIQENVHPPMDHTELGTQKFQDFQKILCGIPNPGDSSFWGIPKFSKILNGFPGISAKIHKISK